MLVLACTCTDFVRGCGVIQSDVGGCGPVATEPTKINVVYMCINFMLFLLIFNCYLLQKPVGSLEVLSEGVLHMVSCNFVY